MPLLREENNHYRLVVDERIDAVILPYEDKKAAVRRITIAWSSVVEKYIRMYPEQWAWMHDRWKTKEELKPNTKRIMV